MINTEVEEVTRAQDTEQAAEADDRQNQRASEQASAQEISPEQWVLQVEQHLGEVLARQKQFQEAVGAIKAQEQILDKLGKGEIRALVEALDIADVEMLLTELQKVREKAPSSKTSPATQDIDRYRDQLEEVAHEKEAARRHVEATSVAGSSKGSLQEQVFENFAEFLGKENAHVRYGGSKLEVKLENGEYIITVPEASFDNMLALAQEMGASLKEGGAEGFAEQLMDAALFMDRQAIFSSESIEALYNTGYRLKRKLQGVEDALEDKRISFKEIQAKADELFGIMPDSKALREKMQGLQERINNAYLNVFLGKHPIELMSDGTTLQIVKKFNQDGKPVKGNLYDALFERWQKSPEGKDWWEEHKDKLGNVNDPKAKSQILEAYDTWLTDGKRQYDLMHRFRKFFESRITPGAGTEQRFGVLLSQWQHMILNTESVHGLREELEKRYGKIWDKDKGKQARENRTPKQELEQIKQLAAFFQPDRQLDAEALKYLPAEVLELFSQKGEEGRWSEAACIVADAYVKNLLQDRGFSVFTNLKGAHTRLVVVSHVDGAAYFVDPSAPQGNDAVVAITEQKILDEIREIREGEVVAKRNVNFESSEGIIADGSALLTSGFLVNMAAEKQKIIRDDQGREIEKEELAPEVKFAAAERAMLLAPNNPNAWLQMAKYAKGEKQKEYLDHVVSLGFDRNTAEALLKPDKKVRIGDWRDAAGVAVSSPTNAQMQTVIDRANAEILAAAPTNPAAGLEALSPIQLQTLDAALGRIRQVIDPLANPAEYQEVLQRESEVGAVYNRKQRERQGPQLFTALTPAQIDILEQGSAREIHALVEEQIAAVSREIQTGAYLNQNAQESIQDKLRPLRQYLDARMASPNASAETQRERDYVVNVIQLYSGLTNVVGLLESGDPKQVEQAVNYANQMDTEGGMIVLHTVSTMHEGRPQGLVSDFRREMKRVMERNFQTEVNAGKPGRYYLISEDYLRLPQTIVAQQLDMARRNIGPYAQAFQQPGGAGPDMAKIQEQLEIDVKLAQMLFVATQESSSIFIQGRFPKGVFDAGAMQFLNAQWQNLDRYLEITGLNMEVAQKQFEYASTEHLEGITDERTKHLVHQLLKNKELFQNYIDLHALNIVAPQTNFWWENRFVRTVQMIQSLNDYENTMFGGTRTAVEYEHIIRPDVKEPAFVPTGGDPEFGILLRAFLYGGGDMYDFKALKADQIRLLEGKAADYFSDILIEPFSHISGVGFTEKGVPADTRFVELFAGDAAVFLGAGGAPAGETALQRYQRAMRNFNRFQDEFRPLMDAIRNKRINNPNGNPVQTNFALNNGTPESARPDVEAMCNALRVNADDFQRFIGAMQHAVRGHGHDDHHSIAHAIAFDPMFENLHYSPMSLIDVPMWMLDGDDLMASNTATNAGNVHGTQVAQIDRHRPLRAQLGGRDRMGRQFKDALELGEKTRMGFIEFIKLRPTDHATAHKIVEKMYEGVANTRGTGTAQEVEEMVMTKFLFMNYPKVADFFGLKDGIAGLRGANTEFRKIFGGRVGSIGWEDILTTTEEHFLPKLPKDKQAKFRRILHTTGWDVFKRKTSQSLFIFLISLLFESWEAVFGAVNPTEQAG